MRIDCDVLVVGAGPAGLSAALLLSKNKISTVVLEKNKSPGPQQTSYDITEGSRICKILNEMRVKPQKISPVSEWFSPNHRFILDSKIEDYYFKRGPEKDSIENVLLEKLSKKYATVFFNSAIDTVEIKKNQIVEINVKRRHEYITIKPQYIIGADGVASHLRKRLQIKTKVYATFRGIGVVVKSEKQDEIPYAYIYLNNRLAPGGYIYSGSVKNTSFYCVVIDDIFSKEIKLRKNLEKFLEQQINREIITKNYFGGIGTSGILTNHITNVLFVGGAALFHNPFFGYGLNYAVESAYTAAQAILQNNMEMYKIYVKEIQQEIKNMYQGRKIWRKANNNFFDRLLQTLNGKYNINDRQINQIIHLFHE